MSLWKQFEFVLGVVGKLCLVCSIHKSSHPALVNVEALDQVMVEAHCKVKCRVYQHPVTKESNLAVLQLIAFSKKDKRIIREHFIPVYINCRPSQKTRARFLGLKRKLQNYLKNFAFLHGNRKIESLGWEYKRDLSSFLAAERNSDLLSPLLPRQRLTVSESSDLASLDRQLLGHESRGGRHMQDSVSRSIPTYLHEDPADSLIRNREFLSSTRTRSSSLLGYATSTESSSSPSSSNLATKRTPAPERQVAPGRLSSPAFSASRLLPATQESSDAAPVQVCSTDVVKTVVTDRRLVHPAAQEPAAVRKTSSHLRPGRSSVHRPGSYNDNDVLVCYCVLFFSLVYASYSWLCGELPVFNIFTLSDSEMKHLVIFISSLLSAGYLICAYCRS
ncbi:hypothetical protein FHG87_005669 [Trinorchestia longiramus]|nr:hypothetical protein FHG87_005669 [Trinorchestia longiramus]